MFKIKILTSVYVTLQNKEKSHDIVEKDIFMEFNKLEIYPGHALAINN